MIEIVSIKENCHQLEAASQKIGLGGDNGKKEKKRTGRKERKKKT